MREDVEKSENERKKSVRISEAVLFAELLGRCGGE
jgi:hypothetical protein